MIDLELAINRFFKIGIFEQYAKMWNSLATRHVLIVGKPKKFKSSYALVNLERCNKNVGEAMSEYKLNTIFYTESL